MKTRVGEVQKARSSEVFSWRDIPLILGVITVGLLVGFLLAETLLWVRDLLEGNWVLPHIH